MAKCYCSILTSNQAIFDGTHKLSSSGSGETTRNCYVARLDDNSELRLCSSGSKPYGLFYDHLDLVYHVTLADASNDCIDINEYNSGKYTNVATGNFIALVGPDAFASGTLPSQNATLYEGDNGKIATSGTYKIGKCIDNAVTVQHRSGSYNAAMCLFEFDHL